MGIGPKSPALHWSPPSSLTLAPRVGDLRQAERWFLQCIPAFHLFVSLALGD